MQRVADVKDKVTSTVSSAFNRINIFAKPVVPHQLFIQPFTRFSTTAELNGVGEALEKISEKRDNLKVAADAKGAQSPEFATYSVLNRLLEGVKEKISAFNQAAIKADIYSNYQDIYTLTEQLKGLIVISDENKNEEDKKTLISEQDKDTLNSVSADKPVARNAILSAAAPVAGVIPLIVLGPGVIAGLAVFGGFMLWKPTNDYMVEQKLISWDAESKQLVEKFVEVLDLVNKNLAKYLETNKPAEDARVQIAGPKPK